MVRWSAFLAQKYAFTQPEEVTSRRTSTYLSFVDVSWQEFLSLCCTARFGNPVLVSKCGLQVRIGSVGCSAWLGDTQAART
jgi:hypothetical protein